MRIANPTNPESRACASQGAFTWHQEPDHCIHVPDHEGASQRSHCQANRRASSMQSSSAACGLVARRSTMHGPVALAVLSACAECSRYVHTAAELCSPRQPAEISEYHECITSTEHGHQICALGEQAGVRLEFPSSLFLERHD